MDSQPKEYVESLLEYVQKVENMLIKSQEEICSKLDLHPKTLEQSEIILMERGLSQHIF